MSNKKIALIIPQLNSGGAERVVSTLANELSYTYEVSIITFIKHDPFYTLNENVELEYCLDSINPSKNFFEAIINNIKLIKQLRVILQRKKIDIVLSFLTSANVLSIIVCKLSNIKVIISERNNPMQDKTQKIWRLLRKNLYKYADVLVVQTEFIKSTLSDYVKKEKIIILPNPINPELSNKRSANIARKKLVLNVGRLTDQKNHELLIKAFSRTEMSDWQLIIIGEGENRAKYEQLIEQLKVKDNVQLIGRQKNVAKYYNSCSVFAFSSNYEGFPNALIEAMHFGMACISTDCPTGPSELIINGKNGYLVPVNDVEEFSKKLNFLMKNIDQVQLLGHRATKTVSDYEISIVADKWRDLIFKLLKQTG